jgi:hypothetical protein
MTLDNKWNPQCSSLMDFIAEIILGYAEHQLVKKIKREKIKDYHILRFREIIESL